MSTLVAFANNENLRNIRSLEDIRATVFDMDSLSARGWIVLWVNSFNGKSLVQM